MRRGAVQVVPQEHGRQRYELTDRLYNLYHLLRRPGGEDRVRALVEVLLQRYAPAQPATELGPPPGPEGGLPLEWRELVKAMAGSHRSG